MLYKWVYIFYWPGQLASFRTGLYVGPSSKCSLKKPGSGSLKKHTQELWLCQFTTAWVFAENAKASTLSEGLFFVLFSIPFWWRLLGCNRRLFPWPWIPWSRDCFCECHRWLKSLRMARADTRPGWDTGIGRRKKSFCEQKKLLIWTKIFLSQAWVNFRQEKDLTVHYFFKLFAFLDYFSLFCTNFYYFLHLFFYFSSLIIFCFSEHCFCSSLDFF